MKNKPSIAWSKIILGIALICAACMGIEEFRRRGGPAPEPELVRPVRTAPLDPDAALDVRRYFGSVQGSQRVNLSFRVPGTLQQLSAEKGSWMKKGDLLAALDPRDFRTSLEQVSGVLAQARAQYNDAAANFKRYEELYNQKVIAAAKFDSYKVQLNVAQSAVRQAEASVSAARDALRDTELHAPFDGVVADRMVENFQDVTAKQPVISFQDVSTLEIVFSVPEQDVLLAPVPAGADMKKIAELSAAFRMTAHFDAIPDRSFPVKLKEFGAQADANTKTYPVTVTLPQPEGALVLPGMAVTVAVDFSGSSSGDTFLVPRSAILDGDAEGAESSVWLFRDGSVTLVPVIVEGGIGDMVEIKSQSLVPGGRIVTAGVHFLHEGQKVRLQKEGER